MASEQERDRLTVDQVPLGIALDVVRSAGFVTLRQKSYRQAQERQRVAEALRQMETENAEHSRQWALNCLDDSRKLRDRLTFVYGVARAHGASVEELSGGPDGA